VRQLWPPTVGKGARELLYVVTGAPLGLIWCTVLLSGLTLGLGLSIVALGIPLLAALGFTRWAANTERGRARLVLGAPIPRPPRQAPRGGLVARWRARLTDWATWKDVGYMLLLGPVGVLSGGVVIVLWSTAIAAMAAPAVSPAAPPQSVLGGFTGIELAGIAVGGVLLAVATVAITHGLAIVCTRIAQGLLAPDERALLAARVSALEVSRAGAVESADARLRRLERDLHDGAQHRLAFIAMELDRARARLATDPEAASELLTRAHDESKKAMSELRDLVRGIHPSVLTDRGLDAAVSGLAERCPVPVDVEIALDERPPDAVETGAYYVVAEALTNVGRHANAEHAAVAVRHNGDVLVVEVRDDGSGGAARTPGSGLEGLAQRVEALDGTLTIDSPLGGPTAIRAQLPWKP
jgi:signal transduction histidine kinase